MLLGYSPHFERLDLYPVLANGKVSDND